MTHAIRALESHGIHHVLREYRYVDHGGTAEAARQLGVDEHAVIKTLVMQDDRKQPLIVLMHGDAEVSTKNLARQIGARSVEPCEPDGAERHTGYQVGGTSPFGTRKKLPVYVERSILDLPRLYINGGRRGLLVSMAPEDLVRVLSPKPVEVALREVKSEK